MARPDPTFFVTTDTGPAGFTVAKSVKGTFPSAHVVVANANKKFVHTASAWENSPKTLLGPVVDWFLLGEFGAIFSCGTSFGLTAIARRKSMVTSAIAHQHRTDQGEFHLFNRIPNLHGNVSDLCGEVVGRRWLSAAQ